MNTYIERQNQIREKWLKLLGGMPAERPAPDARILLEEAGDGFRKIKVSLAGDMTYSDDRIIAWLLIPDGVTTPRPAVLALHSSTCGCGKDLTIGEPERTFPAAESFLAMGEEMLRNRGFALDFVQAGYIVFAPDLYSDGERREAGHRPYELTDFYKRYPNWSAVGKAVYDNMIAIDWLSTLPEVDARRIGVVGHSLGGHSAIFLAGLDQRVKAACSNGGCTVFRKYMEHWARTPLPEELVATNPPVYTYIPGFRPYMSHTEVENPLDFGDVMGLIAPRNVLYGGAIANLGTPGHVEVVQDTWDKAWEIYTQAGAQEALEYNIYPGTHDFPPRARKATLEWFGRVL